MKILVCYPHACYGGGSQYHLYASASELLKSHDVRILLPEPERFQINVPKYDWKIPFRVMGSSSTYWPDAKNYVKLSDDELKMYADALFDSLCETIEHFTPDIIHCHFMLPSGWAAARAHKKYKIPVVITSHGVDVTVPLSDKRYLSGGKEILPEISYITGYSPDHCEWIKEVFGEMASEKVVCIPGGTDTEAYTPDIDTKEAEKMFSIESKKFVLGVGRFQERKGFHILVDAAKNIKSDILLVGGGWEMENLKKQVERLKLTNIRLLGFFGPEKNHLLRQLYCATAIVVIPSITRGETLCFVGLEALSSGTPVVASSIGGLPFLLDNGRIGKLVKPGDANELSDVINGLMSSQMERQRIGKLSREYVIKNFTWPIIAEKFTRLFNSLAN
ncbi:hypothetical protein COY20_02200 [Candidatus Shapirobacteria bacterium CG_4_10_14_0_2_um_filter_40_12]|uniref:Glycosyltransferase family 4 protein n=3 Tax=Bacteria candidate phyla TaxID=1783234 RepID=A0A2M7TT71_9BACT|nr:MAG: hypothetical protein COY20_02200 [Candidatus Shapirobacteria bacterium CG_4_10_14_0_2_um_filter_40_12]PJC68241.1 MAG: hypothetical protein CO015_04740 [candidate division WWE3 bacterium CG_4_8_14_3_um_filter_42_11]